MFVHFFLILFFFINHAVNAHGDNLLKVKTPALVMMKKKVIIMKKWTLKMEYHRISWINFAVPILSVRSTELAPVKPSEIMPGILNYLLDKFAESSNPSKTNKICFDGKKINAFTSGLEGDIVLWGLEHKPTLKERREQLNSEKDLIAIAEATDIVSHVVSKIVGNATVSLTWHNFGRFYRSKFC